MVVPDEPPCDEEGFCDTSRNLLNTVRQVDAIRVAVAQRHTELLDVVGRSDDLDVVDAGHDEVGERVVDRGLVVGRNERLAHPGSIRADALGNRTEASTLASGQNECLQGSSWV